MPGFGIVAAVLGIVITMGAISGPITEIGHSVGAALVGTFLGILIAYGFINPIAVNLEFVGAAEMLYFRAIASSVCSFANGMAPVMAVEVARRSGIAMNVENATVNQAINRWATGDWDLVLATDTESMQPFLAPVAAMIQARVLAARGQDPRPVVEATPERDDVAFYRDLGLAIGQAHAGDLSRALATVRSAVDGAYDFGKVYDDFALFYGVALEIAVTADDGDLMDHLRRVVDEDGSSLPTGLQGHRALLGALDAERVGDDHDAAEAWFLEAQDRYSAWGSPVHLARARAAYAVWLANHGRGGEAEPLLAQARETYTSLGADAWLAELDHRLTGVTVS